MLIPSGQADKIRNFQKAIFHRKDIPKSERQYVFYLLIRPLLEWVKEKLKGIGLEDYEIESELYILSCLLFKRFDPTKSSLVPYLSNHITWRSSVLIKRLSRNREDPYGLIQIDGEYDLQEEFYWTVPNIILEDRYIGNLFTKSERYLISIILESDEDELNQVSIANKLNVNRRTWIARMKDIKELLEAEEFHAST